MSTIFTYPNVSANTGIDGMLTYTNTVTDGFMGMFLLFVAFCGITITTVQLTGQFDSGIAVGCWGASLGAISLFGMGIIGETVLIVCGICSAASTIFILRNR